MRTPYELIKLGPSDSTGGKKRPVVNFFIQGSEGSLDTPAVIDSGADATAIPIAIAEFVGLDLSAEIKESRGVGGMIESKNTRGDISIAPIDSSSPPIPLGVVPIIAVLDEEFDYVLLGRQVVFDKFVITFNQAHQYVDLKPIERKGRQGGPRMKGGFRNRRRKRTI